MSKCLICNNDRSIPIEPSFNFVSSDIRKVKYHSNFFICEVCGCVQKKIDPSYLKNISKIYKDYVGFSKFNEIDQKKILNGCNSNRCEVLFKNFLNKKRYNNVLDYGSSNGAMLLPFIKSNKKLHATDLKCNLNNKILNAKNFIKFYPIKKFINSKKKYDLITMIHVLEHLQEPKKILINLEKKISKNGIIFVQIPNFLLNPYDLSVYDHTIHFDKSSITKLAEVSNLKIIKIDEKLMNGEFSIILKKTNKTIKSKKMKLLILKKINIFKNLKKIVLKLNKIKNLSILGTSIASLFVAHNYKNNIENFYDEDKSKIGKYYEGKKIRQLIKNDKRKIFLPFYDKKLNNIRKRLTKNYDYTLKC